MTTHTPQRLARTSREPVLAPAGPAGEPCAAVVPERAEGVQRLSEEARRGTCLNLWPTV